MAKESAQKRPSPMIPEAAIARIASGANAAAQRQAGIDLAVETIGKLSALKGLRGFEISGGGDDAAAIEVLEKSGLKID
jgi:hypothetical protein